MSDQLEKGGGDPPLTPELQKALASFSVPEARPAFKQQLRVHFLSGSFSEVYESTGPEQADVEHAGPEHADTEHADAVQDETPLRGPSRRDGVRGSGSSARPQRTSAGWRKIAIGLAAAVLLWMGITRPWSSEQPLLWNVSENTAQGASLTVGGRSISIEQGPDLIEAIGAGGEFVNGEQPLDLILGDLVFVEVQPKAHFELGDPSGWSETGDLALAAYSQGLRVATGNDFEGGTLLVSTPHIQVDVVGTIFAVDVYPTGTCVCCNEGKVRLLGLDGTDAGQFEGQGAHFCPTGGEAGPISMPSEHAASLESFARQLPGGWR